MKDYKQLATEARKKILTMIWKAKTSHTASNFSVIDIATVLYENLKENDLVIWSKGWAAASIYYFLYKQGKLTLEDLDKFPNPPFLGLAETKVPGVLVNGGSVGHGLPVAVGMAYAKKLQGETGKVYCILSDGELNEGTVWESAMLAAQLKLDNLVAIVDKNGWQAMGKTEEVINMSPLGAKWKAFNWEVSKVDGHDFQDIKNKLYGSEKVYFRTMDEFMNYRGKPRCLIAETIKGKGVSFMENHLLFHYKHVEDEEYQKAMEELA